MKSILNECVEKVKKSRHRYRRYMTLLLALALVTVIGVNWALRQDGISMTVGTFFGQEEASENTDTSQQSATMGNDAADATAMSNTDTQTDTATDSDTGTTASETSANTDSTDSEELGDYSDDSADVETAEYWETTLPQQLTGDWPSDLVSVASSQIGYTESTANYRFNQDKTEKKGYTRYGEWYGNVYGDWSNMFTAFCLNYAGISTDYIPTNSGAEAWIVDLTKAGIYQEAENYTPKAGDIVFLDQLDTDETDTTEQLADHTAIITSIIEGTDGTIESIKVIEGDTENNKVEEKKIEINDASILGYAQIPQNEEAALAEQEERANAASGNTDANENTDLTSTSGDATYVSGEQTADTENYIVTVSYGADAKIPLNAELRVTEFDTDSEEYQQACEEAGESFDWLLDVSFYQDGKEIEPSAAISISVKAKDASEMTVDDDAEMKIVHFAEAGTEEKSGDDLNIEEDKKGRTEVSFEVESLSLVAGVTYHSATASGYNAYTYGNDLLIYKQSGDYVYFLAGSSSGIVTFRVPLSTLAKSGTDSVTADDVTVYGKTFYAKDSISGEIMQSSSGGYTSSLSWSALVWNEAGLSLKNKATGTYLSLNGTLGLTSSYQEIHAIQGSQDTSSSSGTKYYTRLYQDVDWTRWWTTYTTYYWLEFSNNQFSYNGSYNVKGYITDSVVPEAADVTIAVVGADTTGTEKDTTTVGTSQAAVYTGQIEDLPLGFYSVTMDDSHNVSGLSGVSYTIFNSDGSIAGVITTDSSMRVDLSSLNLDYGTYTMKMTTVPSGYLLNTETWTFTISNSTKTLDLTDEEGNTTGIILINPEGKLTKDKTASVVSYDGRTYQVDLSAKSTIEQLQIDNLTLNLVVDQSNSMLFPANLVETTDDKYAELDSSGHLNIKGAADSNKIYYFVADQDSTATVYAVVKRNGVWYYQDASFYAKAYYGTNSDKITTNDTIAYPDGVTNYTGKNSSGVSVNAGRFGTKYYATDASAIKADLPSSGTKRYTFYESANEYNRLHYLEQSMSDMLQMLAQINPNATVVLDTFTKYAPGTKDHTTCMSRTLNASGLSELQGAIGDITTEGGTRQDLALEHVHNTHTSTQSGNVYTVLITDGAPVSNDSSLKVGTATQTSNASGTIYERINYQANLVKSDNSKLITVGLGMKNVPSGSKMLRYISSDNVSINTTPTSDHGNWWYQPENASDLMDILTNQILNSITTGTKVGHNCETVTDEISDSFYPINPNTNAALTSGTYIDKNGNVLSSSSVVTAYKGKDDDGTWVVRQTKPSSGTWTEIKITNVTWTNKGGTSSYNWWTGQTTVTGGYNIASSWDPVGTVTQASDGSWSVVWDGADLSQDTAWSGRIYLKAKEDFIGGNAIATNKEATITLHDGGSYELETPTVNVRLLGMNQNDSEVTVYKGDIINAAGNTPLDALKTLFGETEFTKLVSGSGNVYNKVKDASTGAAYGESDGVKESTFTLEYALGRSLTDDEWTYLTTADSDGNYPSLTIPYTYNDADGEVGYFTISLNKQSNADGQTADFGEHTADVANGSPNADKSNQIETYTVSVTYTAYKLAGTGETKVDSGKRPDTNVHNGTAGPGTEVGGTSAGTTLETGLGTETSTDTHKVYAIEGKIQLWKELDSSLQSSTEDQTYTFILTQTKDAQGNDIAEADQIKQEKTVTVKAGQTKSDVVEFTGLSRGTYVVSEATDDAYHVSKMSVQTGTNATNCQYSGDGTTAVTFVMGNDTSSANVISKAGNATYTSYTGTPNGVLGQAVITNEKSTYYGELPVKKVWKDNNVSHSDSVYLVLFRNNTMVTDTNGNAKVLELNNSNNYQGTFSIQLDSKNDTTSWKEYSVKELKEVSSSNEGGYQQAATVENMSNKTIYFKAADLMDEKGSASFDKNAYQVYYSTDTSAGSDAIGTLVVTNAAAYALPKAGGMGTRPILMGGLLLITGSLLYGYVLRRRRERRRK
jgi:hypothetical protein